MTHTIIASRLSVCAAACVAFTLTVTVVGVLTHVFSLTASCPYAAISFVDILTHSLPPCMREALFYSYRWGYAHWRTQTACKMTFELFKSDFTLLKNLYRTPLLRKYAGKVWWDWSELNLLHFQCWANTSCWYFAWDVNQQINHYEACILMTLMSHSASWQCFPKETSLHPKVRGKRFGFDFFSPLKY